MMDQIKEHSEQDAVLANKMTLMCKAVVNGEYRQRLVSRFWSQLTQIQHHGGHRVLSRVGLRTADYKLDVMMTGTLSNVCNVISCNKQLGKT